MELVRHGKPRCGLDVMPHAPAPVQYAADELIRFVRGKTGCELPRSDSKGRTILLRLADDSEMCGARMRDPRAQESYVIGADEETAYLIGADPAGVVYAVFDFLGTEVGIGFGGLGDQGVRLGFDPDLRVDIRPRRCEPNLTYRGMQGAIREDAIEAAGGISPLHIQRLDWMAQNRMNYYLVDPGLAGDFDNIRKLLPEVKRRGLKVQWAHHAWARWVPHSKYFKEHPEYFMMVDGKRMGKDHHPQLCLCTSNPKVAEAMANEILGVLNEFPEVDAISLWPEDGEGMCQCELCKELDTLPEGHVVDCVPGTDIPYKRSRRHPNKTVRYAKFVNEVARLVGKVRPDVLLSALFYYDIDAPPKGITLEANVQPCLAHYWRCWRHPLDHEPCENAYFERITREWAAQYPGKLIIYDYLMGMSCYVSLPWPIVPVMHRDWKRYHDMGIAGATIQSQASHFTVYGPTYSAFARMAWRMDTPTDELTRPYYQDLYEEASAPIIRMMSLLEHRFRTEDTHNVEDTHFQQCIFPTPHAITRILDSSLLAALDECIQEAEDLAVQERVRDNVAKLGIALGYWKLAYGFYLSSSRLGSLPESGFEERRKVLKHSISLCKAVMSYLEEVSHVDVIAREMALNVYWTNQYEELERLYG